MSHSAKVKSFLASNYCSDPVLAKAVIAQFGDDEFFVDSASDVVNHGINGGFNGFIYYADTVPFALANRDSIGQLASNDASEMGVDGKFSLFASFKSLSDLNADSCAELFHERDESNDEYTNFWNVLAWYAAESVSRWFVDFVDNEVTAD